MQLLASTKTKSDLIKEINSFWHSKDFGIKDGKPYNTKSKHVPEHYKAYKLKGIWRFEFSMDFE